MSTPDAEKAGPPLPSKRETPMRSFHAGAGGGCGRRSPISRRRFASILPRQRCAKPVRAPLPVPSNAGCEGRRRRHPAAVTHTAYEGPRRRVLKIACAASSKPPAPGSGTCLPTHPTSIRSSRPSPKSNTGCAPLRSAPSRILGDTSEASSKPSLPTNAATTSGTRDMLPSKCETL